MESSPASDASGASDAHGRPVVLPRSWWQPSWRGWVCSLLPAAPFARSLPYASRYTSPSEPTSGAASGGQSLYPERSLVTRSNEQGERQTIHDRFSDTPLAAPPGAY
jgi:hypothetical protein